MTLKSMPSLIIGKLTRYSYQGVSRALVENSRTLRLPTHLHERLGLIRNAKIRLQEKGITPSIDVSWLPLSDKQLLSLHLIFGTLQYQWTWLIQPLITYNHKLECFTFFHLDCQLSFCFYLCFRELPNAWTCLKRKLRMLQRYYMFEIVNCLVHNAWFSCVKC